jgi:hypothetical protein
MIQTRCRELWAVDGGLAGFFRLGQSREQQREGVRGELRAMKGCRWQPPQSFGDSFGCYQARCCDGTAGETLRQKRCRGDRGRASAAEEACFGNGATLDANCQLENIGANRIGRLHFGGGVR